MKIEYLKLKNFRNHKKLTIQLDSGLTMIQGPNGVGKTNILESIYILSTAKSPKAHYDKDLIEHEQQFCSIEGKILTSQDDTTLEILITKSDTYENSSTKRVKVNKVPKTINYFSGIFNSVLFTPQDIVLPAASPSHKRQYLDLIISQVSSVYKKTLSQYNKAVKHRNKVLELILETGHGYDQIDYWNNILEEAGFIIQQQRTELVNFLDINLKREVMQLHDNHTDVEIIYDKSEVTKERFEKYQSAEIASKTTLIGPHRDNFSVKMNGYDIGEFGSRGQQRTIVLGLKLSEIDYIQNKKGERPVLLLDDIFSEFDDKHKLAVANTINKQQTIITGAEIPEFLSQESTQFIHLS